MLHILFHIGGLMRNISPKVWLLLLIEFITFSLINLSPNTTYIDTQSTNLRLCSNYLVEKSERLMDSVTHHEVVLDLTNTAEELKTATLPANRPPLTIFLACISGIEFLLQRFKQREIEKNKRHNYITLGLEDFVSSEVWRASVAEFLGTAILVFMIDTIVISSYETDTNAPKLIISCLVGITIAILVLATLPISGGHLNPIITSSVALIGSISLSRAAVYIMAQCTGAILGALALKAVISSKIEQTYSLGGCTITIIGPGPDGPIITGLDISQAFWLEVICCFGFLFAAGWMGFDPRQATALGRVIVCTVIGLVAGLNGFVSTTVTATKGYSGAGMNPARCLGPAIVRGGHLWTGHWVFWIGPAIASAAFALYTKIIPSQHFNASGET